MLGATVRLAGPTTLLPRDAETLGCPVFDRLEPEGTLVIAGILKTEFPQVQKAFEALGLKMTVSRAEKEWRSGAFLKPRA